MLPPVDPTVLQRNPNFEILYKDLCTRKLNPDGSTRDIKKQRVHDEIRRNLTTHRTKTHTTTLLLSTLSTLPSRCPTLPPSLHPTIDLTTALLTHRIPPTDRAILTGDTQTFLSNIDIIASALSTQLTTLATLLCKIANPTTPPPIAGLRAAAEQLRHSATRALPAELSAQKLELANTTHAVLALHRTLLETGICILELTQHGALSRATKARADYLHARALVLGLQAKMHTHAHPPPAEFVGALKRFREEQGSSEVRLRDREGLARRALELYGRAGEKGMRELARRKGVLSGEIERLERDIEGLERGE